MTRERFWELDKLLAAECHKYDADCSTCPYRKECKEYEAEHKYLCWKSIPCCGCPDMEECTKKKMMADQRKKTKETK